MYEHSLKHGGEGGVAKVPRWTATAMRAMRKSRGVNVARLQQLGGVTFHHAGAFWFGVVAVTAGVIGHLPMYLMGRNTGYRLVGMPMDMPMKIGMAAIIFGLLASLYGPYPRSAETTARAASRIRIAALDDVRLNLTHVGLLV